MYIIKTFQKQHETSKPSLTHAQLFLFSPHLHTTKLHELSSSAKQFHRSICVFLTLTLITLTSDVAASEGGILGHDYKPSQPYRRRDLHYIGYLN